MNVFWLATAITCLGLLLQSNTWAGDTLSDVLREKGIITKEDWTRIEAANENTKSEQTTEKLHEQFPIEVRYGKSGFELKTRDGKFGMQIQHRLQLRYAYPFDSDPRSLSDLDQNQSSFMVRRARLKVGGHAYWPWLNYYMQYDWTQPILRDFYLNLSKFSWAQIRLGRGKVLWNDERVTSSGQQQFANRSIVNDIFTVDRQQGVQIFGRLFPGTWHDFTYYAGVFAGQGVGERDNDDANMMYTGRLQWNFLGREPPFSQSDIILSQQPVASVAFAAMTNISQCTAFETDARSCRNLPGFPDPATAGATSPGQFRLDQMMEEFRFRWRGLSITHEFHWKQVVDTKKAEGDPTRQTNLMGSYAAVGFFPHVLLPAIPKQLEIAGRYAFVDPNVDRSNDIEQERTIAVNWFFAGHANKLTFEVARLTVADPSRSKDRAEERIRLQWDISF